MNDEQTATPDNRVLRTPPWRGRPERTGVVVMDMQEAYFEAAALKERRQQIVAHCTTVLAWAHDLGLPVINVVTQHKRDRSTWTLNMLEDDQGYLFEGDAHTATLDELDLDDATEVVKTRDDAFVGTDLQEVVTELDLDALVIVGVSTHTCVAATAAHAFAIQREVVLVRDAIGSHRPELHELALDTLRDEYRLPVLDAEQLRRVTVP
ncbi:isochorismatase family cysteine hydrolase [Janibacter sp. DB-40]|uniref:cysteine hydrolase family protein n=1 Tax=Janibacter sp. DB-40 TaxID=3028808 RepID=UPI002405A808|nr:isochorismatase family cysteine hydrolase [Janibacter sp. DB-40]